MNHSFTLRCRSQLRVFDRPVVMGIINTTPDSFYEGSRLSSVDAVLFRAEQMIAEGAGILDIGGQSTRPGSTLVAQAEELRRVLPAMEAVRRRFPEQLISIDSFYAAVVREAAAAGADIVNDVTAGQIDAELIPAVAALQMPYVLMHMKGHPSNMQQQPQYRNVTAEVFDFFSFTMASLVQAGIRDIIIDPGFGFGKTAAHNFELLRHLSWFRQLGRPLMVGLSRKGTIYRTLGITAEESLNGTTVMHTLALQNGAALLRVHDVKEAVQAVRLHEAYKKEKSS